MLIDAECGSLLETWFRLPFVFVVPDLLYQQELEEHGDPTLIQFNADMSALLRQGFEWRPEEAALAVSELVTGYPTRSD